MKNSEFKDGCNCQNRRFIIQIENSQNYPFYGLKPKNFYPMVKMKIPAKEIVDAFSVLQKISQISNKKFIQLLEILEEHGQNQFYILTYQYVPFSIEIALHGLSQEQKINIFESDLYEICAQLVKFRIKPTPKIENFGLTVDKQLKFYLNPNFETLKEMSRQQESVEIKEMVNEYKYIISRGFINNAETIHRKISEDEKIQNVSEKIKKLRHDIFKIEMKTYENKNCSSSEKNSVENSDQFNHTGKDEGIQSSRVHSDKEPSFQDSYSCRMVGKDKKKRTSSFQLDQKKPRSENKHKKGSWAEENSTIVQSDRASQLKLRISQALQKTQNTLKKYEKLKTNQPKKRKKF